MSNWIEALHEFLLLGSAIFVSQGGQDAIELPWVTDNSANSGWPYRIVIAGLDSGSSERLPPGGQTTLIHGGLIS